MSATRLHVLLDGYELSASHHRGIGTYLRHLIAGLGDDGGLELDVLATGGVALPEGARRVPLGALGPARWRDQLHARRLPRGLRRSEAAVLHTPGRTLPDRVDRPWVHTLHDLTPLVIDHPALRRERRMWEAQAPRLRDAAVVITPSRSTATTAVDLLGLDPDRVTVIPHGVDPALRPGADDERAQHPPHLLWVSSWGPHKGLADALAVIDALAEQGLPHELRIIGWNDPWMRAQIAEAIRDARHPERVHVAGWVADLGAAYRAATALLVTSRSEGFCFPALESMASGTPVIAYDNSAIPEVLGEAGVLVADGDVGALAAAVGALLLTPGGAAGCVERGLSRAAQLTWRASVSAHAGVYLAAAR